MKLLAFDCSAPVGSLAVLDEERVMFSETFESPRGRGTGLFQVLQRAVTQCGRPDRIGVGIGPGSYNGLRTAIAAAEGLRIATGAELVGIVSVRALPSDADRYLAVSDARGGVFYCAEIAARELVGDFELLPEEALAERFRVQEHLPVFAPAALRQFPQVQVACPDAVILARLAAEDSPVEGTLEPLYLKPAHITTPKNSASSRLRGGGS